MGLSRPFVTPMGLNGYKRIKYAVAKQDLERIPQWVSNIFLVDVIPHDERERITTTVNGERIVLCNGVGAVLDPEYARNSLRYLTERIAPILNVRVRVYRRSKDGRWHVVWRDERDG